MSTNIAVIPARGGSKRIPRKNIRNFNGIPAITRTIQFIISTKIFSEIIVTTDDQEISDLSFDSGATRVINRSELLSGDYVPTVPVVANALREFGVKEGADVNICCIYPINPFLDFAVIESGRKALLEHTSISYVNPIVTYSYPIERALRLNDSNALIMVNESNLLKRSQDFEEFYHDAGQWYWGKADAWLREEPLLSNSIGLPISRWVAQDIDTNEDWTQAELLFNLLQSSLHQGD